MIKQVLKIKKMHVKKILHKYWNSTIAIGIMQIFKYSNVLYFLPSTMCDQSVLSVQFNSNTSLSRACLVKSYDHFLKKFITGSLRSMQYLHICKSLKRSCLKNISGILIRLLTYITSTCIYYNLQKKFIYIPVVM